MSNNDNYKYHIQITVAQLPVLTIYCKKKSISLFIYIADRKATACSCRFFYSTCFQLFSTTTAFHSPSPEGNLLSWSKRELMQISRKRVSQSRISVIKGSNCDFEMRLIGRVTKCDERWRTSWLRVLKMWKWLTIIKGTKMKCFV